MASKKGRWLKKGKINFKPMQPGDVKSTYANVENLFNYIGFSIIIFTIVTIINKLRGRNVKKQND